MDLENKFWNACKAIGGEKKFDKGFNKDICFLNLINPKILIFYREEVAMLTPEASTKTVRDITFENNEMVIHTDYGKVEINKRGIIGRERGSLWGD